MLILGFIILTSAATVNIMTIKPATPIKTISGGFGGYGASNASNASKWINKMATKGYMVKNTTSNEYGILVVMEKY